MRDNDDFFDFRDSRHDCDDDFDFCDEGCETGYESGRRIRDLGRGDFDFDRRRRDIDDCDCRGEREHDCDCGRNREKECECGHDRDRDCDCKCDRDKDCDCERDRDCDRRWDRDCCEETIHCSNFRDFNEDERFGCNKRYDAAQSDDSWFDCQEEECCQKCRTMCDEERSFCRKLKCRIQVLDFVLQETVLFLDTHPCDFEALRYYRIIRRKLARLERLYECKCGPLTNKGVDTEFGWEWACCPWPWEGKD